MSERVIRRLLETVPADVRAEAVWMGVYATLVSGLQGGLASTFRGPCTSHSGQGVADAGELSGQRLLDLAERALSDRLIEASLGMAALNAAILPPKNARLTDMNAQDILLERGAGRRVVIVGEFPFITRLKDRFDRLDLIQEPPENGLAGVRRARSLFPDADVIALTASSLINHTFDDLLDAASHAFVIVLGATTPLSPLLFDFGADALCGTLVTDITAASTGVMQGAPFRKLDGVRRVTWLKKDYLSSLKEQGVTI